MNTCACGSSKLVESFVAMKKALQNDFCVVRIMEHTVNVKRE